MKATFSKGRLEAFSDGVIAIIITIMVLELKVPHAGNGTAAASAWESFAALRPLLPVFLSYLLSFIYVGIYWNNHHHMLHATREISGGVLWANLHLLFWMSLIPFVTGWMGENHFSAAAVMLYGVILLFCGIAYQMLQSTIVCIQGNESVLGRAIGSDRKGRLSIAGYALAVGVALAWPWLAQVLYAAIAALWFVPDRRIERALIEQRGHGVDGHR